jgi:hypothetical protein
MTNTLKRTRFQTIKRIALFCALLFGLYILFMGVLAILVQTNTLASVVDAGRSRWLLVIRLSIYTALWLGWKPLLRKCGATLSDEAIRASRRPLAILILAYEFLFASEIPQLIGLLFEGN